MIFQKSLPPPNKQQIRGACTLTAGKIFPNSEKMIDSTDSKFQEKYAEYIFTEDDCSRAGFHRAEEKFYFNKMS